MTQCLSQVETVLQEHQDQREHRLAQFRDSFRQFMMQLAQEGTPHSAQQFNYIVIDRVLSYQGMTFKEVRKVIHQWEAKCPLIRIHWSTVIEGITLVPNVTAHQEEGLETEFLVAHHAFQQLYQRLLASHQPLVDSIKALLDHPDIVAKVKEKPHATLVVRLDSDDWIKFLDRVGRLPCRTSPERDDSLVHLLRAEHVCCGGTKEANWFMALVCEQCPIIFKFQVSTERKWPKWWRKQVVMRIQWRI